MIHIHATLHRALRDAVRWGRLTRNPAEYAVPPRASALRSSELKTWSAEQLADFLEHVRPDRLYAAWVLAATTGLRRGELLGLHWSDIDLDEARLSVRRSLVSVGYAVRISEPKTRRGRRQIALDKTTVSALLGHRRRQMQERLSWGPAWVDSGFVFTKEDGTPLHPDRFTKLFAQRVKSSGLPRIRLHDLRHTHATLALQAGRHPKVVSERLGHANVSITLDVYRDVIPAMQKEAADLVAELVFGDSRQIP